MKPQRLETRVTARKLSKEETARLREELRRQAKEVKREGVARPARKA